MAVAHESTTSDKVWALLLSYTPERQADGITVKELLSDHRGQLKSDTSVIAAVDLLNEEGKVICKTSAGHQDPRDGIRIFPLAHREEHRGYFIEVFLRLLNDGTFNAHGFVRKPNPSGSGLPFETSFDTHGQRHLTADAALRAGISFAKALIDCR